MSKKHKNKNFIQLFIKAVIAIAALISAIAQLIEALK